MPDFGILIPITITALGVLLSRSPFFLTSIPPPEGDWAIGSPIPMITTPSYLTNKAIYVKDRDKADFLSYSLTFHKFVKSHHDDEEKNLFPKIEEILNDKTIFVETYKEHESFLGGLAEFHTYLSGLKKPASLSGAELVRIMSSFEAPFAQHFTNEIATIAALASHDAAPAPGSAAEASAALAFKAWGKATVSKAGLFDVLPMFMLNLDRTAENGMWHNWPPMPKPVRFVLVNIIGAVRGPLWKFASCDARGQPRQLHALPHAEK